MRGEFNGSHSTETVKHNNTKRVDDDDDDDVASGDSQAIRLIVDRSCIVVIEACVVVL